MEWNRAFRNKPEMKKYSQLIYNKRGENIQLEKTHTFFSDKGPSFRLMTTRQSSSHSYFALVPSFLSIVSSAAPSWQRNHNRLLSQKDASHLCAMRSLVALLSLRGGAHGRLREDTGWWRPAAPGFFLPLPQQLGTLSQILSILTLSRLASFQTSKGPVFVPVNASRLMAPVGQIGKKP